jgi:serine/threonine protein kinase
MAPTAEIRHGAVLADRYRILERVGTGGTATVFLAEDLVLGRQVAVKRLHAAGGEPDRRRFRREARLGAALNHPNLVTVYDTVSAGDGVLIVMEHVRGRSLAELIPGQGMEPYRLLRILRPVASALDFAHHHGVVHRDIKPANIVIADDGRVKLVDLGTATATDLTQITTEYQVMGTLAYIAPERLSGESVGEPPADVYSLAVVAFEGLAGERPYASATPAELLGRVHSARADVRDAWPEAPDSVARVLAQGMDPDPARRQLGAGALVRDLDDALAEQPAAPVQRKVVWNRPEPRQPRWLLPALVCVLALVIGGAWLAISSGGGGGDRGTERSQTADRPEPGQRSAERSPAGGGDRDQSATSVPPSPSPRSSSRATASALNDQGFSLINEGRYEEAIPVLREAVASFPPGSDDLTYAYALYNLGHALRAAGEPEQAIPILERRLEIPNQTATVQQELAAARAEAGR